MDNKLLLQSKHRKHRRQIFYEESDSSIVPMKEVMTLEGRDGQ